MRSEIGRGLFPQATFSIACMIVAAHQPNYLPNLGFFYKMLQAELFVIVTNLQFEKQEGWQQRHKIMGPNGDIWLTVPVLGSQNQKVREVQINNAFDWRKKQRKTLELTYAKSRAGDSLQKIVKLYENPWDRLVDLNVAGILLLKEMLGIPTPVVVDEEVSGEKHNLLINICKKYGANTYLSGAGAKEYMTREYLADLEASGISHSLVQRNLTAEYPYSTIHYIFIEGRQAVLDLLHRP